MYVRDLEVNCLLKPSDGYAWQIRPIHDPINANDEDALAELRNAGISHHGSVLFKSGYRKNTLKQPVGVYLGTRQLSNYYFGVKKQHVVMVGSMIFVLDGYNFGEVEKV